MNNERFIAGIYNYCDYWCERCAFTGRCRNFDMKDRLERRAKGEPPVTDTTRQAFWNELADNIRESSMFEQSMDGLDDTEYDFDDMPDNSVFEEQEKNRRAAVRKHALTRLAKTYMQKVGAMIKLFDSDFKDIADELVQSAGNTFDKTDYEEQARQIGEMIEVILWYHTLLYPKISRAIGDMFEYEEDKRDNGEYAAISADAHLDDANGTAKLVLVSIRRSIAAWLKMREIMPHREDEILEMLVILDRLQRGIHQVMPDAEAFIRPGFDETQYF